MRLSLRASAAGVCAGAVGMFAAGTLAPTQAATYAYPAPAGLRASSATATSITVVWTAVPKAPAYRVKISLKSSMKSANSTTTTKPTSTLSGLLPGKRYYLNVRVVSTSDAKLSDKSPVIQVSTTGGPTPTPTSTAKASPAPKPTPTTKPTGTTRPPQKLRVAKANWRSLTVDWADQPGAASYRLQLSRNPSMVDGVESPVPASAAALYGLAHKQKYYARVRGIDSAGRALGGWSGILAVLTPAAPPIPRKPALGIASYNVRCANCYTGQNEEKPWSTRRSAVVSQIISRKPDVLGIQEASQARLNGSKISQFDDLGARLRAAGVPYQVTNANRFNCRNPMASSGCKPQYQGASQGTRIFYNSATVDLLDQGSKLLPSCSGCNNRYTAWALFRQKATGSSFFVANVHTQFMWKYAKLRAEELKVMMDEVARRNPKHLPTFVMGDFNSTRYQTPTNAPYDEVISRGFVDPLGHTARSPVVSALASVENRARANYNSHNNFIRTVAKFPDWQNGSNIDYILTTPMRVLQWETVLNIDAHDRIVGTIPSDHNMVMIKAVLP